MVSAGPCCSVMSHRPDFCAVSWANAGGAAMLDALETSATANPSVNAKRIDRGFIACLWGNRVVRRAVRRRLLHRAVGRRLARRRTGRRTPAPDFQIGDQCEDKPSHAVASREGTMTAGSSATTRPGSRDSRSDAPGRARRVRLFLHELERLLRTAGPIVGSQLGQVGMNTVDTLMVGRLGATSLAAAAFSSAVHITTLQICFGVVMGMSPLVSQAFGAGELHRCRQ